MVLDTVFAYVRNYLPALIVGVLLGAGGFSARQAIAIGLMLFVVYQRARARLESQHEMIRPFAVTIHPNWYLLLKDHGLIDDKWPNLREQVSGKDAQYNVLQYGISFTVLPPVAKGFSPKGWAPGLIYSNNHHVFLSRTDLFRGIREQISEKLPPLSPYSISLYPMFYARLMPVQPNEVGLEMGVRTPESYERASEYSPNSDLVPVATLPPEVFEYYFRPQDYEFGTPRWFKYRERFTARLAEFGWKEDSESGLSYEHKYATVYIREIV